MMSIKGKTSNYADLYIAQKLRQRRLELGLSQRKLAACLGISAQQLSKYENNLDRLPAGRLVELKHHLQVPVNFFYEEDNGALPNGKGIVMACSTNKDRVILKVSLEEGTISQIEVV
ncbi:helix-turn-helix domain-containing protein [Candidatus Odyssella thessalonicensis]|uniref:helix-turn-helix domain-containing protein n=1 Tax=Candidatus Odyssella thessalonicensis TaxID=84647 RepID=UPI0002D8AB59|nr:helix-turn-helix transcriptional regulator [Candidatus Odyssella thessalonicensis]